MSQRVNGSVSNHRESWFFRPVIWIPFKLDGCFYIPQRAIVLLFGTFNFLNAIHIFSSKKNRYQFEGAARYSLFVFSAWTHNSSCLIISIFDHLEQMKLNANLEHLHPVPQMIHRRQGFLKHLSRVRRTILDMREVW